MLPVLILNALQKQPKQIHRLAVASSIRRSFASHHTPSSSEDPPLVTGMPKLLIPQEYQHLVDVKQEQGYVVINGRRYPYPYPGIHKEYNYLQLLDKWRTEGKVDRDNRPIFSKMRGREKTLALQLWFQRDPSTPVHKLGKFDQTVNGWWATGMIFGIMLAMYQTYRIITPKEKDVFIAENWNRWHKEHH